MAQIRRGLTLDDGPVKVDEVSYVQGASKREIGLEIHSGKNRIVRRIFEHLGYEIVSLDRVVLPGLTKRPFKRNVAALDQTRNQFFKDVINKNSELRTGSGLWYLQESNQGHKDFQSFALPTELRYHVLRQMNKTLG